MFKSSTSTFLELPVLKDDAANLSHVRHKGVKKVTPTCVEYKHLQENEK